MRTWAPLFALLATAGLAAGVSAADSENGDEPATAIFAAGCFWCVEEAFDKVEGVLETISGYTGGEVANPSYEQVSTGATGHTEALRVRYDPAIVDYETLLETFWHNVDPTDAGGQFCDRGDPYRSGIFVHSERQRRLAEASKQALQKDPDTPSPIVTPIEDAGSFYPAEEYHQDYYQKNPLRYRLYKNACGRADRLEELWSPSQPSQ
jgi:peptide-methionine (S)-S-oxide reductase